MRNFTLLCFLLVIYFIQAQNTNVQNELDTKNTQIFYFNHLPLVANDSDSDYFKPYLAYLNKNGNSYNPIDYLMDSFILIDFYYKYSGNPNKPTPFQGIYEQKYLDSYIKDVFKRTKLPIIEMSNSGLNNGEALIVANKKAALAYKIGGFVNTNPLTLKFDVKLKAGYSNTNSQSIFIGYNFFNAQNERIDESCDNDSLSPCDWLDMYYRPLSAPSDNFSVDQNICVPSSAVSIKFFIINYNIDQASELKIDNVKLLSGSSNLIPAGDSTFNLGNGFNNYNENSTKWEFYKKYDGKCSREYLFEDRESGIIDRINQSRSALSNSIALPPTNLILTLPAININHYKNNINELTSSIDYFINEIDSKYNNWVNSGGDSTKIKIKGLYLFDEYIKDTHGDIMEPVIIFIKDKLAQKNWKLYGSPYAQFNSECTVASSYSDETINSVDIVWQQPNSFFLARDTMNNTYEIDREVLRMANTLASSKSMNINIENRIKEENEPYGRINDYFDYGEKYGYINYSKLYYDSQGAHYSNCYSTEEEKRIDYDNLYQFIKKARNGVVINNKFETISESDNTKFHNWCGDYSIKTNSFSQSNERLLEVSVTTTAKIYSEYIPIKEGLNYKVDFTPLCVPTTNKALVGVIFYDNNDSPITDLNPNFTNLKEHYQGNYYVYVNANTNDPNTYDFFNFLAPANAVKFKFYLDKWDTSNVTFKNIKFYETGQISQNRLIYKYNNSDILKLENKIKNGNYSLKLDEYKFAYTCEKISVRTDINYQLKVSTKEILPIKDLSKQTKALIAIKTFNKEGAKINVPIVGFDGYSGNLDMYYKYIPNIGQVWQEFTQNLSFPSNVASIEVYLYNWYYDNTILFDNFSFQQAGIDNEIPINTDNLFNKEKWNEKPPFIVSFQKPVFYNEFIDVSSYSQLNFSALLRDSETINGSNRDLLAIQFYDSNFNILSNTEILSPTNFSWSSFYKYWWSGSYFPINSQECYQANGTDTRKWYYNQWNTYDNTINIPSNVNYIRVSLNKLNESAIEDFLVLHPILKVTGERKPQKNTTLPLKNKEIPTSLNISIYPNPSNEYIKINFPDNVTGKFEYSIFDVSGKQITQGYMTSEDRLDISKFSTGIYIIKIASETSSFYNKFIKI